MKIADLTLSQDVRALNPALEPDTDFEFACARPRRRERPNADKKGIFLSIWREYAPAGAPEPVGSRGKECLFNRPHSKHRFDFAFPNPLLTHPIRGVAVEVDGATFMVRQGRNGRKMVGGRHNSDKDRHKINLAAVRGWLVLRYSIPMLKRDPLGVVKQVLAALEMLK